MVDNFERTGPVSPSRRLEMELTSDDIYKVLRLRGYEYGGKFKGIVQADNKGNIFLLLLLLLVLLLNPLAVSETKLLKGLGSIRGVFGPMSKINFTLSNYSFVIWDKNYRRYFVI